MSRHANIVAFLVEDRRLVTMNDLDSARAFLLETAIEMYLADGHPRERAERMARDLLQSEVTFDLPALFDDD